MTYRHFQIFVAVSDSLSMTAAAEQLFISQSAVSQAINALEKYYQVRLFERYSRRLFVTPAGERFYSYAQHILGMYEEIEKTMRGIGQNGPLRLGASVTVGAYVLPALVAAFKRLHPKIEIVVSEDNTSVIEGCLLSDKTDIGLVEGDISSDDIITQAFSDDELTLVCGVGHRLAGLATVTADDLEGEDFIIRESGSGTRKTFENVMNAHQIGFKPAWVCNNTDTIKEAVMAGLGISVLPWIAVQNEIAAERLIAKEVAGLSFRRTFTIAYHKDKYLTDPMKEFIAFCLAGRG